MKILGLSAMTSQGVGLDPLLSILSTSARELEQKKRIYSYLERDIEIFDYRTPNFDLGEGITSAVARRLGKFAKLTHHSMNLAIEDSEIHITDKTRVGMLVGSGFGPSSTNHNYMKKLAAFGGKGASPVLFSNSLYNTAASFNSLTKKFHGPCMTISNFEISTSLCLKTAQLWLDHDVVDYVLVCVADEFYDYSTIGIVMQNHTPMKQFNPFDPETKISGEGGACFLLGRTNEPSKYRAHIKTAIGSKVQKSFKYIDSTTPLIVDFKAEAYTDKFLSEHGINQNLVSYGAMYGHFPTSGAIDLALAIKMLQEKKLYPGLGHSSIGDFIENEIKNIEKLNLLHIGNRGEYGEIQVSY